MPISREEFENLPEVTSKRDEILEVLRKQAYTQKELAEMFGVKRSTIWNQLNRLMKAGLVAKKRTPNGVYYIATE